MVKKRKKHIYALLFTKQDRVRAKGVYTTKMSIAANKNAIIY
jgi:hypothetical protein